MKPRNRIKQQQSKPDAGRWAKDLWLSGEFIEWCKTHGYKPEGLADCILHTLALKKHGKIVILGEGKPVRVDDIYDLGNSEE